MRKPVDPEEPKEMIQMQRTPAGGSGYPDDPAMREQLLMKMREILNSPSWQAVDTNPLRQLLLANSPLVGASSSDDVVIGSSVNLRIR